MTDQELLKQAFDEGLRELSAARELGRKQGLEMATEHEFVSVEKLKSMTINELVSFLYDGENKMTDKELLKQAHDALDKITDMFEAVNGRCVIGGDDVYYSAVKVMVKLNDRLKQPEETNQCAETHERAKLCNGCGGSLTQEQEPVVWRYTDAQGKTGVAVSSYKPYEDAVPLFTSEPQKPCKPIHHWRSLQFNGGRPISQPIQFHGGRPVSQPKQKPWVGLTDEEIEKCYETTGHYQTLRPQDRFAVFALVRAIEAKLKEKNR